jgi:hypothetical protein
VQRVRIDAMSSTGGIGPNTWNFEIDYAGHCAGAGSLLPSSSLLRGRVHELQPARPCGSTRRGAASSRSRRQQAAAGPAAGRAAQHCWCAAAAAGATATAGPSFIAGPQQHPPPPSVLPRCRGAQQAQHRLAPWAAVLRGPPLVCPWEGSVVPVSCYLRWGSFEAATQGRGHGGMGLPAW